MKKVVFVAAMLLAIVGAKAQTNIQEMYDFKRGHFTTTLEMFKSDPWGSTFFFNDIYHPTDQLTPTGYYTEIARALNFWQNTALAPISLHVEWNGGQFASNAWLFGVEYFLHNESYTNTFTFELMYKRISGQKDLNALPAVARPFDKVSDIPIQFTFVWGMQNLFGVHGLTFSGFLDVWGENVNWGLTDKLEWDNTKLVILSEPQIWYNIGQHFGCNHLMIGGEVELAYNFAGGWHGGGDFAKNKGFNVAPCAGIKWAF